LPFITKI